MSASITLIGAISLSHVKQFEAWLASYQISAQRSRLTDSADPVAVERFDLAQPFNEAQVSEVRDHLLRWSDTSQIDHIYQAVSPDISKPGVAVFDMDSTLIKAEVMDELAVEAGIGEEIALITASAMRGEIDFTNSFIQRLSLLEGLSSSVMDRVFQRIEHMEGIARLMKVLHHFHWHSAILSGGFTYFADRVAAQYKMSEVHANVLEILDGKLTGKHLGAIVDAKRKRDLLENLVATTNTPWRQTIACGDGANDLLMLDKATLGVALHAKPLVRQKAPQPMNNMGLDGILYLLGMTSAEIRELEML